MTTPSPTVFVSTSSKRFWSLVSPNRRLPAPRTTGKTISRTSSTRSSSSRAFTPLVISTAHPPYLKSSDPPGSSMTPSSETNSVTTILPMLSPLVASDGRATILNLLVEYELSTTFAALADPTRRAILERLSSGEATVNELAEPFPISVQAVSKHLRVLERAGLVERGRTAQHRPSALRAAPLREAADWLQAYRRLWQGSFDQLEQRLRDGDG